MRSRRGFYLMMLYGILLCGSCNKGTGKKIEINGKLPVINPDYINVTVPPDIAPLNFTIKESQGPFRITAISEKSGFTLHVRSSDGEVRFPGKKWKKLIQETRGSRIRIEIVQESSEKNAIEGFEPIMINVSEDDMDPYIAYRLILPGYYSWSGIKLMQRSLSSFDEEPLFENRIMEKNCVNCHSFSSNNPGRFLMHVRGSLGGTYFVDDGKITKVDPKIDAMPGGATYPAWHPSGRFVAFSSNQVRQSFFSNPGKSIEVFDLVSSIVLYDRESNETILISDGDTTDYQQTFPSWSPDGKYLYFCRAVQKINPDNPELGQIMDMHYNLVRKTFDPVLRIFGETEVVFNASETGKSVSFPRISPDGRYLVFTMADYGTFPVWHREADLYLLNLHTGKACKMDINSCETESYHSWSSNGRWLVFSSKRIDGRSARPFFVHINSDGSQEKEFVLPQKDPSLYDHMLESFNIPELINGKIAVGPRDFEAASHMTTLTARQGNTSDTLSGRKTGVNKMMELKRNEGAIHE